MKPDTPTERLLTRCMPGMLESVPMAALAGFNAGGASRVDRLSRRFRVRQRSLDSYKAAVKEIMTLKLVVLRSLGLMLFVFALASTCGASSIVGSRHDILSDLANGNSIMRGTINNYGEICVYCHTPHSASTTTDAPLWNRPTPTGPYALYSSSTMDTTPGNPGGVSLACLSCHDGTIAVDAVLNAPGGGVNLSGPWYGVSQASKHYKMVDATVHTGGECGQCHTGSWGHDARMSYIGTDLRDDHPISMSYPTPAQDPDFNQPPDPDRGWGGQSSSDIKLYSGKVECPSCHNVHDPTNAPFLRKPLAQSGLCLTCHVK